MTAFAPPRLLRSRHVQSVATQLPWRRRRVRSRARGLIEAPAATLIDCGGGVRLQGFLHEAEGGNRGLIVLLHGWEGSSDSSYVLSVAAALLADGFSVFRLNFRDHGGTEALNEELFHSCRIEEVLNAVIAVRQRFGHGRFFGIVGQSLGGNFALRIAARAATAGLALDRVIAVCPVLEPASTMRALDEGWWVYRHYFLSRWRRSLQAKAAYFPHLYDFGDLRRFPTLTSTTAYFVERYTEFGSLDRYLAGYAVTGDALAPLAVPTRIIAAADDPFIPLVDRNAVASPAALEWTVLPCGGHCGFIDRMLGPSWADREIVADLERAARAGRSQSESG